MPSISLRLPRFFFIDAGAIATAVALYFVAGMFGIGMAYHRLLTHRSYKTPKWIEYFLTWCGTLALEGGPIFWVATHRVHHQNSDQEGDPHTPREGTWWAHMGWILIGDGLHHDATCWPLRTRPGRDPVHVWLSKYHWRPTSSLASSCSRSADAVRALGHLLPNDARPACHLAGELRHPHVGLAPLHDPRRLHEQLVGRALTFGEGWHNNHHAHPTARATAWPGTNRSELDGISALEALGLAWDIKVAKIRQPLPEETPTSMPEEAVA